jgi:hypothetical protein
VRLRRPSVAGVGPPLRGACVRHNVPPDSAATRWQRVSPAERRPWGPSRDRDCPNRRYAGFAIASPHGLLTSLQTHQTLR